MMMLSVAASLAFPSFPSPLSFLRRKKDQHLGARPWLFSSGAQAEYGSVHGITLIERE